MVRRYQVDTAKSICRFFGNARGLHLRSTCRKFVYHARQNHQDRSARPFFLLSFVLVVAPLLRAPILLYARNPFRNAIYANHVKSEPRSNASFIRLSNFQNGGAVYESDSSVVDAIELARNAFYTFRFHSRMVRRSFRIVGGKP